MYKLLLYILLLLFITACSSPGTAIKQDETFFSRNNNEWKKILHDKIIPIRQNKEYLCLDPTQSTVSIITSDNANFSYYITHPPLPENISNSLSDFGEVIGITEIVFSKEEAYDFTKSYFIVKDENIGYLYIPKNNLKRFDDSFAIKRSVDCIDGKCFQIDFFGLYGESEGLKLFIDLYNAEISHDGTSVLMLMKIKNTTNQDKIFDIENKKISFFIKNRKSKNKLLFPLYFFNRYLDTPIKSITKFEPYELRKYYIKHEFKDKNESLGFQMILQFTKIHIDGMEYSQKEAKVVKDLWGGA